MFEKRLATASIALLSSVVLYVAAGQEPFDLDRERAEPTWGDPSCRVIPRDAGVLAMAHLHVNDTDVRADRNARVATGHPRGSWLMKASWANRHQATSP